MNNHPPRQQRPVAIGQIMQKVKSSLKELISSFNTEGRQETLPKHVRETIELSDDMSEALVKLIQLIIFSIWGVLYFTSTKPNPETESWVPIIVAIYLVITLIGFIWACNRRIPAPVVYCSIFIDTALMIFLIGSFHIQYEQSASFSLKAPAMLNLFVLIALRTLRFQARFVLAAGLMAILGWIVLVIYVVTSDPDNMMVTRDYVVYLTSNSVLIGAEISKLIAILMVTIILAIAVRRAYNLLVMSVLEGNAAHSLARFFDDSVASRIRAAGSELSAGDGVRRDAAILNVDIRGFSRMSAKMQPAEAVRILSEYQAHIVPIIHKNGGTIDKFMGDGILASYGAVSDSETSCADALRTIDEINSSLNSLDKDTYLRSALRPEKINTAVASGPVIFGAVGDKERLEYTVVGAAVNLSAKLEKHNKTLGSIALTTKETYDAATAQGYSREADVEVTSSAINDVEGLNELVILA
jgi:adenylate cyclase